MNQSYYKFAPINGELGLFHPLKQSYITLLITGRGPILYFNEVFSAFVDEDDPTSFLISILLGWCLEKRILKTWHVLLPRMRLDQVGPSENWTTTTTDDIYHCHNYRQKKNYILLRGPWESLLYKPRAEYCTCITPAKPTNPRLFTQFSPILGACKRCNSVAGPHGWKSKNRGVWYPKMDGENNGKPY